MDSSQHAGLDRLSVGIISALIFLLPILFVPVAGAPFVFSKVVLAMVAVLVLMLILTARTLKRGIVELPWSFLVVSLIVLPALYLVAALFSAHPQLSFWGYQLEGDTFGFVALASALALLTAALIPARSIVLPLLAFLGAAWVAFLFQIVQVLFKAPFAVGSFAIPTGNLVGSWPEFGIFSGLVVVVSLFTLSSFALSAFHRVVMLVTLVVGLCFLALTSLGSVWVIVGLIAFGILAHTLTVQYVRRDSGAEGRAVITPALTLLVALFFMFLGGGVATSLQSLAGTDSVDVRPSFQGTLQVMSGVYADSPLLGSGPNTFSSAWLLHRPQGVLTTLFWDTAFPTGAGTIPTAFVTGGIVGGLGWLAVIVALLTTLVRAFLMLPGSGDRRHVLTAVAGLGTAYLAFMHIAYAPTAGLTLLFFIMLGLFIASLKETPLVAVLKVSMSASPRIGFVAVMVVILLSLVAVASAYGVGRAYVGAVHYNRAVVAAAEGNLDAATASLTSARLLVDTDQHYRALAALDLARISNVISSGETDEAAQTAFRDALVRAVEASGLAVARDPNRYENWLTRADVYAAVVPFGIEGARENALAALDRARLLSPQSPEIDLRLAEVRAAASDLAGARTAIASALQKKADYTRAILFLAQLELDEGNIDRAIESVKGAVYFEPQNPTLLYQLGVLLLSDRQYEDAVVAFDVAITASPDFANAKFFLAQAYAFIGQIDDAVPLMKELVDQNPDNATIRDYLTALERGENPFTPAEPPPGEGDESLN